MESRPTEGTLISEIEGPNGIWRLETDDQGPAMGTCLRWVSQEGTREDAGCEHMVERADEPTMLFSARRPSQADPDLDAVWGMTRGREVRIDLDNGRAGPVAVTDLGTVRVWATTIPAQAEVERLVTYDSHDHVIAEDPGPPNMRME